MSALSEIPVQEFLEKVKAKSVQLRVDGDCIRIGWPERTPDPEMRQDIIDRKPEILEALSVEPGCPASLDHLTEAERGYYFDLLEIMQSPKHGMDRETAEREAAAIIAEYRLRKNSGEKGVRGVSPPK